MLLIIHSITLAEIDEKQTQEHRPIVVFVVVVVVFFFLISGKRTDEKDIQETKQKKIKHSYKKRKEQNKIRNKQTTRICMPKKNSDVYLENKSIKNNML